MLCLFLVICRCFIKFFVFDIGLKKQTFRNQGIPFFPGLSSKHANVVESTDLLELLFLSIFLESVEKRAV